MSIAAITHSITIHNDSTSWTYTCLNFCIAHLGYNYIYWSVYFIHKHQLNLERRAWMYQHRIFTIITCMTSAMVAGFIFFDLSPYTKYLITLFVCFSLLYIIPTKKPRGLRWIPGSKLIVITASWVFLSTIIPTLTSKTNPTLLGAAITFLVAGLTVPFDLRDIDTDTPALKTVPQLIGRNNTIYLSQFFILLFCLIITYSSSLSFGFSTGLFSIVAIATINKLRTYRYHNYVNFYIEGLPLLWLSLILIASAF